MSAVLEPGKVGRAPAWWGWLPVFGGFLLLYVPTFHDLATSHWQREEGGHGPIIVAIVAWLIWRERRALAVAGEPARLAGFIALLAGLLLYAVGRPMQIAVFEVGSLPLVLGAVVLAMRGWMLLRVLWFPILFACFLIPLPELLVDAVTAPLKQGVSALAEFVLHGAGYPVGRSGVVLTIGPYQLLVADACSGLQSMISLAALGLLYLRLAGRGGRLHNTIMLLGILPIAFVANVVRVLLLMLITYHLGDAAGQGFLHDATGILLLLLALSGLMLLDFTLARTLGTRGAPRANARAH